MNFFVAQFLELALNLMTLASVLGEILPPSGKPGVRAAEELVLIALFLQDIAKACDAGGEGLVFVHAVSHGKMKGRAGGAGEEGENRGPGPAGRVKSAQPFRVGKGEVFPDQFRQIRNVIVFRLPPSCGLGG